MKKTIQVIIKTKKTKNQNHFTASIKNVPLGYALNYLIPKQIAEIATEGKIKHYEMLNKKI